MTPDVRVVRGEPDEVELAALVAGLLNGASGAVAGEHPGVAAARRRWREGARPLAHPLEPGRDAWRWSRRFGDNSVR